MYLDYTAMKTYQPYDLHRRAYVNSVTVPPELASILADGSNIGKTKNIMRRKEKET
jgi:hypothetical protein